MSLVADAPAVLESPKFKEWLKTAPKDNASLAQHLMHLTYTMSLALEALKSAEKNLQAATSDNEKLLQFLNRSNATTTIEWINSQIALSFVVSMPKASRAKFFQDLEVSSALKGKLAVFETEASK